MSIKEKLFGSPGTVHDFRDEHLTEEEQELVKPRDEPPAAKPVSQPAAAKPVELVKQLISNKFIEVSLQMIATPDGLRNGMVFMIVNQSGRGTEKKSIPIAFEPVTGWPLADFTKEELGI